MKNLIILIVVSVFLTACGSISTKKIENEADSQANKPNMISEKSDRRLIAAELPVGDTNAMLSLAFDESGQWARTTTQGAAEVAEESIESSSAIESAYMIATLRAKRVLAEFLSTDVRSTRTLKRIEKTIVKGDQRRKGNTDLNSIDEMEGTLEEESQKNVHAERLASVLTERITDQTSAILRGAHITQRFQRGNTVVVELAVSRESIDSARDISKRMRTAF